MKKRVKLNWIEKIRLYYQGKHDATNNQFQNMDNKSSADLVVKISPFVRTEVQRYECAGMKFLKKHHYKVLLRRGGFRRYMKLQVALYKLDAEIEKNKREKDKDKENYLSEKELLDGKIKRQIDASKQLHLIRKEQNNQTKKTNEFNLRQKKFDDELVRLEYEKKRLKTMARIELLYRWEHCILRIRYYYEKASYFQEGLNAVFLDKNMLDNDILAEVLWSEEGKGSVNETRPKKEEMNDFEKQMRSLLQNGT